MIAGELDLSVGSMAAVSAVLTIQFESLGLFGAIALATVAAAVFGAVQGFLIARLRINSLVFTVATLILLRGLAYIFSGGGPIALTDYTMSDPLLGRFAVLSGPINVAIIVFVAVGLFLAFTRWGREIYAIGGARQEATIAGVPVRRAITVTFTLSAGCAGLAGAMSAMRGASATPAAFDGLLLAAVAAALIGGISLYGGRGGVLHVALGVAIVSLVSAGLAVRGEQNYVVQLATGALLFLVIALEFFARRVPDSPAAPPPSPQA
jgi:ribose/xylose/arabinose/galactoside ABC-type transport system permease subunit